MTSINEMELDIAELQVLEKEAKRSNVKDLLNLEMGRLQQCVVKEESQVAGDHSHQYGDTPPTTTATPPSGHSAMVHHESIKNYAWDQSDAFLKLYVTLKGVHALDKAAVSSNFADQSVTLEVSGLNERNSELRISRLAEQIEPSASYHKVKTDTVLVMLKKKKSGKRWACVTEREKLAKEMKSKPPPKMDDSDPQANLMGMLQNMYEEGDDEMKRMFKKAMYESRMKQNSEMPGL